jgi:SAM-dependent methyltransferase
MDTPRIAALIASRNRPDLVDAMVTRLRASSSLPIDFHVVECGTDLDKLSAHSTLWYADGDFRGKCYGHDLALSAARRAAAQDPQLAARGGYDYYWVLMNDVVFDDGVDAARLLVETLEREPRLALVSPTNADGGYPGAERRPGGGVRAVTTCDYLGFMMRREALEEVGFLNPAFRYCWGAIHELAFKCYRAGWWLGYSDDVAYRHLGGTTYGAAGTNTISRAEYQARAKRFAHEYFLAQYGPNWSDEFWAATRGHAIEHDTFAIHRELWSDGAWRARRRTVGAEREELLAPRSADGLVRLHLGCGRDHRAGWINVDTNPALGPDVVADVHDLVDFADGSVDVIEANHLFEHLTHHDARRALREWRRVLRPDGELFLELPDLEACLRILGRYTDDRGYDLGLIGIHGWPPMVEEEGVPQIHKWSWTRRALAAELASAGFGEVDFGPVTQVWRQAAKVGRDMRVRARGQSAALRRPDPAPLATLVSTRNDVGTAARAADPALATTVELERFAMQNHEHTRVLFAWPDYTNPNEVEHLFREFALPLEGRGAFVMRYDQSVDGPRPDVVASLDRACGRVFGQRPFDVVLVDHDLDPIGWRQIGDMVEAAVVLPSSTHPTRRNGLASLRTRLVARFADLPATSPNAA